MMKKRVVTVFTVFSILAVLLASGAVSISAAPPYAEYDSHSGILHLNGSTAAATVPQITGAVSAPGGDFIQMNPLSVIIMVFQDGSLAIPDGTGAADLRIHTYDALFPADAEIWVSMDNVSYTSVGIHTDTADIDIDLEGIGPVKYVRIDQADHPIAPPHLLLGFDLDAVEALYPGSAVETFDVTVNAEAGGNPLAVPITGVYDSTSADGTTSYTINDVPDGNTVTLTAPLIHIEGSNVYAFEYWDVGDPDPVDWSATSFTVDADITATAYYQRLENYVTGGGNLKDEVQKGNRTIEKVTYTFGGNVGISDVHGIVGNFQIVDHTGAKAEAWHCTTGDFVFLVFGDDAGDLGAETPEASNDIAVFVGDFSSNRGNEATLMVFIWDNQEPGKDFDTICVMKWDETAEDWVPWVGSLFSPETISGGNFQLHDYE